MHEMMNLTNSGYVESLVSPCQYSISMVRTANATDMLHTVKSFFVATYFIGRREIK